MIALLLAVLAQDGNRLTYLDESDPYYVHRKFPKLTTPQWVGEEGVEAVVVLAIDDMRGHEKWETYLRPILERLKKIDGRAPVSIMTCTIDPNHAHLQKWLKEGVSIEVHTVDHPCPLLKDGDLAKAKSTYDRCVDLLNLVPNNKPVAFRMPCCDSLNTPSPRFYAEIFNRETPGGHFLTIDTSVFNITTSNDPDLPKELTTDPDGKEKFRKYLPFPSFVNTIEDYPYPYVIGKLCWEFPCIVPSDWEAQNLNKPFAAQTVADMKAALDAVVLKQGTFNFVYHPHGWIKAEQVVELIDHAVEKHGKKVKFLTFREADERLRKNLLYGSSLRRLSGGTDQHIRILDVNNDGYMDVVTIDREVGHHTKIWQPGTRSWKEVESPLIDGGKLRFGTFSKTGFASAVGPDGLWAFDGEGWEENRKAKLPAKGRLIDVDGDGSCELVSESGKVYTLDKDWSPLPFSLPVPLSYSVRFVDLNGDGRLDVVTSNESGWGVYLWKDFKTGWEPVATGKPGDPGAIPLITRGATNNGAWFHSKHLWVQNEDTAKMPNLVDRRSFQQLLQR